jgi:hypothetical protein
MFMTVRNTERQVSVGESRTLNETRRLRLGQGAFWSKDAVSGNWTDAVWFGAALRR